MEFGYEKKEYAFKTLQTGFLWWEPHMHSHMEIVFIEKYGKSTVFADEKSVVVEENDLFIAFPNQIHYYEDIVRPMTAKVLIISPAMCPEFKKIFDRYVPVSPVLKNAGDNPLIRMAVETISECSDKMDEYSETVARGALLILLSEIFKAMPLEKVAQHNTDVLKELLNYCYDNYTTDISLDSVANNLHLSKYYISRLFNRRLKISFNDYINSLRIRKACELLKSDNNSITDIAFSVGYNSVRTFNRCFREVRGTSPRKYQLETLNKKEAYKTI